MFFELLSSSKTVPSYDFSRSGSSTLSTDISGVMVLNSMNTSVCTEMSVN